MSDRRKRIESNLFGEADKVDPKELDSSIFGGNGWFDNVLEDESITFINIYKLRADLTQPRRALPSFLYKDWRGTADDIAAVYEAWLHAINEERGSNLNLRTYFDAANNERSDENAPEMSGQSLEADFMAVVDLAVSIRRDGLTNPITAARSGDTYTIETGERRWLAFHLLHLLFAADDGEQWLNIPARIVDRVNIWRQANENNLRADLNAIDKARQFALLLMDLLQQRGTDFMPLAYILEQGGSERDFYAQVMDSDTYRVPRGYGEQIINAMGLKNIRQLSYYRNLLSMPEVAWRIADDYNLAERALRECLQVANGDPEYIINMVKHLVNQSDGANNNNQGVAVPDASQHTNSPQSAPGSDSPYGYADFSKHARTVQRYLIKPGKLQKQEKHDALQKIEAMRQWLSLIEQQLHEK